MPAIASLDTYMQECGIFWGLRLNILGLWVCVSRVWGLGDVRAECGVWGM